MVLCLYGYSKILMLGSITATDGMRKGFYYASQRNQFWQLLDCVLGTTCFSDLKDQLKNNYDNYKNGLIDFDTFEENKNKIKETMAFEIKTNAIEEFEIFVEVQLYKEISLPSNWEELTDEAKSLWEKENRIKDRQFTSGFVGNRVDGFSVSFTEGKTKLDSSYQIRIYFSTKNFSSEEKDNNIQDTDYLKNFMIDNFIVLTKGE